MTSDSEKTPYQHGYDAGLAGKPGPPFTTPDTRWSDRLYERGWIAGSMAREDKKREKV